MSESLPECKLHTSSTKFVLASFIPICPFLHHILDRKPACCISPSYCFKTSPKGLQVQFRESNIFKIRNFLRNCLEIVWIVWGFLGFFLRNFLGRNFFFWRIFFGGFFWRIFWEGFFGRIF